MSRWIKINEKVVIVLQALILAYVVTIISLLVLALFAYKSGLSEGVVSLVITIIYIVTTFISGFYIGKKMRTGKFLWGLLAGVAYFLVLAGISLLINNGQAHDAGHFVTTFFLCAGSGMLGGMLS